ncbi:MAG TPA: hypothetical protein VER33_27410 [Polyangiaceae bacterium]|nr:hypothetical protein [Polyangiaceae bacterium]
MDKEEALPRLLAIAGSPQVCLLGGIDPYGDTVFNRVQAPRVLAEWREVEEKAKTLDERELCRSIGEFFEEAERGVHQYVRFIGD